MNDPLQRLKKKYFIETTMIRLSTLAALTIVALVVHHFVSLFLQGLAQIIP